MYDLEHMVSGIFSDYLDELGQYGNVYSNLSPFQAIHKIFGRVRTVKLVDAPGEPENIELGLSFLEQVSPGEILCVEGSMEYAYFGELMTRMSIRNDVAGAIIDGLTRDSSFVSTAGLPVFSAGVTPVDIKGRGKVAEVDGPIRLGTLEVTPGMLVFADNDAIVRIPREAEKDVLKNLQKLINEEIEIIKRINSGESVSNILHFHRGF